MTVIYDFNGNRLRGEFSKELRKGHRAGMTRYSGIYAAVYPHAPRTTGSALHGSIRRSSHTLQPQVQAWSMGAGLVQPTYYPYVFVAYD